MQNGSVDRATSALKLQGEDLVLPLQALISILHASDKSHSHCSSSHPYEGTGRVDSVDELEFLQRDVPSRFKTELLFS